MKVILIEKSSTARVHFQIWNFMEVLLLWYCEMIEVIMNVIIFSFEISEILEVFKKR